MLTFLAICHVLIGIGLVVFVLLQDPKDGAAGIFGGGSSSKSFFGSTGASNFLSTTTKWLAVLFACSSLLLSGMTSKRPSSVLDQPDSSVPAAPVGIGTSQPEGSVGVGTSQPAQPAADGAKDDAQKPNPAAPEAPKDK